MKQCLGVSVTERSEPPNEKHPRLPGQLPTVPNRSLVLEIAESKPSGLLAAESIENKGRKRKIDGYRKRGKGCQFLIRSADIKNIDGYPVEIAVCEMVPAGPLGGQNRVEAYRRSPRSREVKLLDKQDLQALLREHQPFCCSTIACQRPKPGKDYVNLPETIVIGTLGGVDNHRPEYGFSRSTLLQVYGKGSVDTLLGPIMHMARPKWNSRKYKTDTPVGDNALRSSALPQPKLVALAKARGSCSPFSESKTVPNGHQSFRVRALSSVRREDSVTLFAEERTPSNDVHELLRLTALPSEILLMIIGHSNDPQLPSLAINGRKSDNPGSFPGLLTTNKLLRGLTLDWFHHQKLTIEYWAWHSVIEHLPLLQSAHVVRFDLSYIPNKKGIGFHIPFQLIRDIWKETNNLRHVEIFSPATPPGKAWEDFPDILPLQLKNSFLLHVIQPLIQFFEEENIQYTTLVDTDHDKALAPATDAFGKTALNWAARHGQDHLVEQILPHPGINQPDNVGNTPLLNAVYWGSYRTMKLIIGTGQADVNRRGWRSLTPLGAAIMVKDKPKTALLLQEGKAAPNTFMSGTFPNALWLAARGNYRDGVNLLLKDLSVDCNVRNNKGQTPLHAVIDRHGEEAVEVVRALVGRTDLSIADDHSQTPFSLAEEREYVSITEELRKVVATGDAPVEPEVIDEVNKRR